MQNQPQSAVMEVQPTMLANTSSVIANSNVVAEGPAAFDLSSIGRVNERTHDLSTIGRYNERLVAAAAETQQ